MLIQMCVCVCYFTRIYHIYNMSETSGKPLDAVYMRAIEILQSMHGADVSEFGPAAVLAIVRGYSGGQWECFMEQLGARVLCDVWSMAKRIRAPVVARSTDAKTTMEMLEHMAKSVEPEIEPPELVRRNPPKTIEMECRSCGGVYRLKQGHIKSICKDSGFRSEWVCPDKACMAQNVCAGRLF